MSAKELVLIAKDKHNAISLRKDKDIATVSTQTDTDFAETNDKNKQQDGIVNSDEKKSETPQTDTNYKVKCVICVSRQNTRESDKKAETQKEKGCKMVTILLCLFYFYFISLFKVFTCIFLFYVLLTS